MKTAHVSIWTVTLDGDNVGTETSVFPTEIAARTFLYNALRDNYSVTPMESTSLGELSNLWVNTADGCCLIEEWKLDAPIIEQN